MQDSNDDERIRDHLANERTYLAWLRTGMAMMGFGVVIAKLDTADNRHHSCLQYRTLVYRNRSFDCYDLGLALCRCSKSNTSEKL